MANEQRSFVFALVFILLFSGLTIAIPIDLQGEGDTPNELESFNPSLAFGWEDSENWQKDNCSSHGIIPDYDYEYTLNTKDWKWYTLAGASIFSLSQKVYFFGIWLGETLSCDFISETGINRGHVLDWSYVNIDDSNGTAIYSLSLSGSGQSVGDLVIFWNTSLYADPSDAWDNDVLYFAHGVGFVDTATVDATSLLVGILTLQLPDCPPLVTLIIASPLYACVIYLIWFIIKESLPFV